MHVLIPYAACEDPACQAVRRSLALPQLQGLIARLSAPTMDEAPVDALSLAHERQLAAGRGLDPLAPAWAALRAHELGIPDAATDAWAFITPSHWELGQAHVTLRDPQALVLTEDESRALMSAMQPYFAEDGITLHYEQPLRWLAQGEPLRKLVCASVARVVGRDVAPWMPASPLLRRLQNEMQMLLYTHAVNDTRAQTGALAVNSFWLDGCGTLAALPDQSGAESAASCIVPQALLQTARRGDWSAWGQAWQAIDAGELATLRAALDAGRTDVRLTLCGEQQARGYALTARGGWARLKSRLMPPRLSEILNLT